MAVYWNLESCMGWQVDPLVALWNFVSAFLISQLLLLCVLVTLALFLSSVA